MELYGKKSKSLSQKAIVIVAELIFIYLVYEILFKDLGEVIYSWFGWEAPQGNYYRNTIVLTFCVTIFLRFTFMMLYLLKREMPTEEVFSVSIAFLIYYVGFSLLAANSHQSVSFLDYLGIVLFLTGSFLNTCSEIQRNTWKKKEENKGKLFTEGLFKYAMHINYFGDVLWVTGFAFVTRNIWSFVIPVLLLGFFVFSNIPMLDKYLKDKYKDQFDRYASGTKKLIPFVY